MIRWVRQFAVACAGVLVAAPGLSAAAHTAPAEGDTAQECGAHGVTVVVDYGALGDGVRQGCAEEGADQPAATIFPSAGFPLEYAVRGAGFVCRVTEAPAEAGCVDAAPATAYWSLWWSDGTGEWTYATRGPQSLRIPAGGWVGFAWHEGSGKATPPDVVPGQAGEHGAQAGPPPDGVADSVEESDDAGLPLWVPLGVGVLVIAVGAAVALRRRQT